MRYPLTLAIVAALFAVVLPPVCARQTGTGTKGSKVIEVDETSNAKTVAVHMGNTLVVSLRENPTTGYMWEVSNSGAGQMRLVATKSDKPTHPGLVGASTTKHWIFETVKPGKMRLQMAYRRAWEKGKAAAKTLKVDIVIK